MKICIFLFLISSTCFAQNLNFKESTLSPSLLKKTYQHLSPSSFETKLKESLDSPLMFFRSFVNSYYADLASQKNISQTPIFCFGDAHLENFGFILFNQETHFVFNDLDDSGNCYIEFDILRYFTSLKLSKYSDIPIGELIRSYVGGDEGIGSKLPMRFLPNLLKKKEKIIKKYLSASFEFKPHSDYQFIQASEKTRLLRDLKKQDLLQDTDIYDVVEVDRASGGSGGLRRYWLSVSANNDHDILELKELSTPGVSYLSLIQFPQRERIKIAKNIFWKKTPDFYHVINFQAAHYLIRSRSKDGVNLSDYTATDRFVFFNEQVRILSRVHRPHFLNKNKEEFIQWIDHNSDILKERYLNTFNFLKSK